jgi:CRISPR-associated protein Csm2
MSDQVSPSDIRQIVTSDASELLIEHAKALGESLKEGGLTTSQIRSIFGTVRQIEMMWTPSADQDPDKQAQAIRKLILLKPKLAYQAERHDPVKPLEAVLRQAIDQVRGNRENFVRFVEFFEAILAYHTASGGGQ